MRNGRQPERGIDPRIIARLTLYGRVLHRQVDDLVDADACDTLSARRYVGRAIDEAFVRLAEDPGVQRPERLLLREVRHCFPIAHLPHVVLAINETMSAAVEFLETPECQDLLIGRCLATTRSGGQCRRPPVTGEDYCPSHRHVRRAEPTARNDRPRAVTSPRGRALDPAKRAVA